MNQTRDNKQVFNQSSPFVDVDLFALNQPLADAVSANGGAAHAAELSDFGKHWGSAAMVERARTRLAGDHGSLYGATNLGDCEIRNLLDRALPA